MHSGECEEGQSKRQRQQTLLSQSSSEGSSLPLKDGVLLDHFLEFLKLCFLLTKPSQRPNTKQNQLLKT